MLFIDFIKKKSAFIFLAIALDEKALLGRVGIGVGATACERSTHIGATVRLFPLPFRPGEEVKLLPIRFYPITQRQTC